LKKFNLFSKIGHFFVVNKKNILVWVLISALVGGGIYLHIDKGIITVAVVVFGIIGNAFAGIAAIVSVVPIIGHF